MDSRRVGQKPFRQSSQPLNLRPTMYIVYQEEELFITLTARTEASEGELLTPSQIRWLGTVEQAGQLIEIMEFTEASVA